MISMDASLCFALKKNKSNGVFQESETWKQVNDKKFHVEISKW
jgi:hypothetical protein